MLLDYLAYDSVTQIFVVMSLGLCYVATLINRRVTKAQEADREDKRAARAVVVRNN